MSKSRNVLSKAHELSRPWILDPAYSDHAAVPARHSFQMASTRKGPSWLYAPGDLEAWLLASVREEGHRCSKNVYFPGLFRNFSAVAHFRATIHLKSLTKTAFTVTVRHSGHLRISLNGSCRLEHRSKLGGQVVSISLTPFLQKGENNFLLTVNSSSEPCVIQVRGPAAITTVVWECSHDTQCWEKPEAIPALRDTLPHREDLPSVPVAFESRGEGLFQSKVEYLGSIGFRSERKQKIFCVAGESREEVESPEKAEQHPFQRNAAAGEEIKSGPLAVSWFSLGEGKISKLQCLAEAYPLAYRGAFASGNKLLTQIWMHSAYTLRLCMRQLVMDGLKRDRMPWAGDLYVAALGNAMSFAESGPLRRTLSALGNFNPRRGHVNGITDYTLYWILSLERYSWYSGDVEFVKPFRAQVDEILASLAEDENEEGWLMPKEHDWLFLDWAEMNKSGVVSALQFIYLWTLQAVVRLADRAGWKKIGDKTKVKIRTLTARYHDCFWSEKDGAYTDIPQKDRAAKIGRHGNFFALLAGLPSRTQALRIRDNVLNNPSVPAVGTPYMRFFENLARAKVGDLNGMEEDVLGYWGGMLTEGAQTFWEAYDPSEKGAEHLAFYGRSFARSLCHAWSCGPLALLSEELSGVRMLAPGGKVFTLSRQARLKTALYVTIPAGEGVMSVERSKSCTRVIVPVGSEFRQFKDSRWLRHAGPCSLKI